MFRHDKLNLYLFIVLVGLQALGVVALLTRFQWSYLPIMLAIYFWAGLSTTLYLHRYLTHRGFEMPEWLKFIFALGSAVSLAGDPVTWVGDHRYHHLKSDTDEDIHSPLHGFPYAHMMWLVRKPADFRDKSLRYAADVRKIWYCRLWERPYFYIIPHLLVAATLYLEELDALRNELSIGAATNGAKPPGRNFAAHTPPLPSSVRENFPFATPATRAPASWSKTR